jgi:hypothetical protein
MPKTRGLIRSLNRRGTRANMSPPVARLTKTLKEPAICETCGAVYANKTWRRGRRMAGELLETASFTVCPACKEQNTSGLCYGKVLVSGAYANANGEAIIRRIENVAKRAAYTQPERRIVSLGWEGKTLEVLTTSQKLAHRIARELKKAFGGRTTYAWSDSDGTLSATWRKESARVS